MDLIERIFPDEYPQQYLYISANRIRIISAASGRMETTDEFYFDPKRLAASTTELTQNLGERLRLVKTGLIFDPHFFIFNLFDFEKIPLSPKTRRTMIEWRLQKVFPEKMDQYSHLYFRTSAKQYFSILISRETHQFWENLLNSLKIPVIFSGNSTVEICNHLFHKQKTPGFFIEVTPTALVTVFCHRRKLLYFRKTKYSIVAEIVDDVLRTLQFINTQYSWKPDSWNLIDFFELVDRKKFQEEMIKTGCKPAPTPATPLFFLPKRT